MNDPGEKTLLSIPRVGEAAVPGGDELYRAVRDAVADSYTLLGELGRGRQGSVVYLVRDRTTEKLAALKLDKTPGTEAEYALTAVPQLDESIPSPGAVCPYCNAPLTGWVQYCGKCGRDVSGVTSGVSGFSTDQLLAAVHAAAQDTYEVLGEMPRARGGGVVYFARDLATQGIVALRLQRMGASDEGEFSLDRTSLLTPLVESMGAEYASPTLLGAVPPVAPPVTPTPAAAPPSPPAAAPPVRYEPTEARHAVPPAAPPPAPPPPAAHHAAPRPPAPGDRTEVLRPLPDGGTSPYAPRPAVSEPFAPVTGAPLPDDAPVPAAAAIGHVPPPRGRRRMLVLAGVAAAAVVAIAVAMATLGGGDENALDPAVPPADTSGAPSLATPAAAPAAQPVVPPPGTAPSAPSSTPTSTGSPSANPARITVRLPAGARLRIDGKAASAAGPIALPPGRHTFVVRAPGYLTLEEVRVLAEGSSTRWSPVLRPVPVASAPAGGGSTTTTVAETPQPVTCASSSAARDWARARSLCQADAASGSAAAQRTLAMILLRGDGGPVDEVGGVRALRSAADAGDAEAQYELARAQLALARFRDEEQAFQNFRKAGNQGHREAQYRTALAYEAGRGTDRDYAQAFVWFDRAAKQGHAGALYSAGVYLKDGRRGVARDETRALDLLTRAGQAGSRDAYFHLGQMHEKGMANLPRSREAAREAYARGVALGSEAARRALADLK